MDVYLVSLRTNIMIYLLNTLDLALAARILADRVRCSREEKRRRYNGKRDERIEEARRNYS